MYFFFVFVNKLAKAAGQSSNTHPCSDMKDVREEWSCIVAVKENSLIVQSILRNIEAQQQKQQQQQTMEQ